MADEDFPFGVCLPRFSLPTQPLLAGFHPPPLSPLGTPLSLSLSGLPCCCPLSVCHPCPSPPPGRQLTIFNSQAAIKIGAGIRAAPSRARCPASTPNGLKVLALAAGRPQRADRGPPAPGGGGAVRAAQRGDPATTLLADMATTIMETTTTMATTTTRRAAPHAEDSTAQVRAPRVRAAGSRGGLMSA